MHDSMTILVVDDEDVILDIFTDFLEQKTGYSVLTARDGIQGLQVFRDASPDFCFTDISMPGMDGITFARHIQEMDNTVPVVVMTGFPSLENTIPALKMGVVDFLIKPFKIAEVELVIQRALQQKALFVENLLLKGEMKRKEELEVLNRELSDKVGELEKMIMVLEGMDWKKSSADLFSDMVTISAKISGADRSSFYLLDDVSGSPVRIASYERSPDPSVRALPSGIESALRQVFEDSVALLFEEIRDQEILRSGVTSLLVVPFRIRDKTFGVLSVSNENGSARLAEEDLHYLSFMLKRAAYAVENAALYENLHQNLFDTLYAFVEAIEARDPYTKKHSVCVAEMSVGIAQQMGLSAQDLDLLSFAGRLHDIGKIGIRDNILLKEGPLTEEEYAIIKRHPIIGANIIGHLDLLTEERKIIRHHHERWDGKGYPDGLKTDAIPLLSRILAVADTFDAMTSDRAYRRRLSSELAYRTLLENAGTQFDPEVVDAFTHFYRQHLSPGGEFEFAFSPHLAAPGTC